MRLFKIYLIAGVVCFWPGFSADLVNFSVQSQEVLIDGAWVPTPVDGIRVWSLDSTIEFRVRIKADRDVVEPVFTLLPPATCTRNFFNSTTTSNPTGITASSSTDLNDPSKPGGEWVEFSVHHFYDSQSCDGEICGNDEILVFSVQADFNYLSQSVSQEITTSPDSALSFRASFSESLVLDDALVEMIDWHSVPSGGYSFLVNNVYDRPIPDFSSDPDQRVVVYFDWYTLNENLPAYENWAIPIGKNISNNDTDYVRPIARYNAGENVSVLDSQSVIPVISDGLRVPLADLGGAGINDKTLGIGINIFDVTDATGNHGAPVTNYLHFDPNTTYYTPGYAVSLLQVRQVKLYLAHYAHCQSYTTIFGEEPASTEFKVDTFSLDLNGRLSGSLVVPALWAQNGSLKTNYRTQWYLVKGPYKYILPDAQNTDLSISCTVSGLSVLDGWSLEARVIYEDSSTQAMVSTQSSQTPDLFPNVPIAEGNVYWPLPNGFTGDETMGTDGDTYLDPGEKVVLPFEYDFGSLTMSSVKYGYVADDGSLVYQPDSVDGSYKVVSTTGSVTYVDPTAGQVVPIPVMRMDSTPLQLSGSGFLNLPYELLYIPEGFSHIAKMFVEFKETIDGTEQTLRYRFNLGEEVFGRTGFGLDLDGQDLENVLTPVTGWFMDADIDPCTFPDCIPTPVGAPDILWSQNPNYPDPQDPDISEFVGTNNGFDHYYQTLTSQEFDIPTTDSPSVFAFDRSLEFSFDQKLFVPFYQAGGFLQYRFLDQNGVPLDTQANGGYRNVSYLNPTAGFYDDFLCQSPGLLADEGYNTWVAGDDETDPLLVPWDNKVLTFNAPIAAKKVSFRFLYEYPEPQFRGVQTANAWNLKDVTLKYATSELDNFLGIDPVLTTGTNCVQPLPESAASFADYEFWWFADLGSLFQYYDRDSALDFSSDPCFPFGSPGDLVFVAIRNTVDGTVRIISYSSCVCSLPSTSLSLWNNPDESVMDLVNTCNILLDPCLNPN